MILWLWKAWGEFGIRANDHVLITYRKKAPQVYVLSFSMYLLFFSLYIYFYLYSYEHVGISILEIHITVYNIIEPTGCQIGQNGFVKSPSGSAGKRRSRFMWTTGTFSKSHKPKRQNAAQKRCLQTNYPGCPCAQRHTQPRLAATLHSTCSAIITVIMNLLLFPIKMFLIALRLHWFPCKRPFSWEHLHWGILRDLDQAHHTLAPSANKEGLISK